MEIRIPGAESGELPPYMGEVSKKYIPGYGKDSFFVELKVNDRLRQKAMFSEPHFSVFEIGDFIGYEAASSPGGEWHRVSSGHDVTLLRRAQFEPEELVIGLGYVSAPRTIGDQEYFVSKSDEGWLRIPGEVMRAYFFGISEAATVSNLPRYYAILELPSMEVSREEIRQAFRRLARQWHPDVNSSPEAEDRFKEINEAHQELGDESRRRLYDRQARAALGENGSIHNGSPLAVPFWPGRGFGKLSAIISRRGDTLLVEEILSWERNRRYIEFDFPLSKIDYRNWGIEVKHEGWALSISRDDLPFEPNEIFDRIKEALEGEVVIACEAVESGAWDFERSQVVRRWDIDSETLRMEWSDSVLQQMERVVLAFQEAQRLREAMRTLRGQQLWTRERLESLAEEYDVDVESLADSFWREDYDAEFFKALEVNSQEILYTDWFFVMRVGSAIVVEQPTYGTATYVFDGSQDPVEIAIKFSEVNRLELRSDPELQQELGYRGFAIHTTIGPWFTKIHGMIQRGGR